MIHLHVVLEQAKLIYSKKSVQFALGWYWGGDSLERSMREISRMIEIFLGVG